MEFKCEDCGTLSNVNMYTQKVSGTHKVYRVLCSECMKKRTENGEYLAMVGSYAIPDNFVSKSETTTSNDNSTANTCVSSSETATGGNDYIKNNPNTKQTFNSPYFDNVIAHKSSKIFGNIAIAIACIGFFLGIILGQVFPTLDYYDGETFNFGLMIGTWAGTAVLFISLWAVRCILNYQEIIIEKLNKN